jgi:E3 ubiquitin-protein ligase NEDD4
MLGKTLTIHDLESVGPEFYHSLSWIRENNLDENDNLELYFNRTFELLGKIENIELKLGGNDIKLTVDNKGEYLELLTKWRFTRGIEDQTKAFLHGFNEVSFSIFFIKQEFCSCSS